MKQLRQYIRRVGLLLCALFALLALYGVYSLTNYGSRWFSTSANTWLRSAKQDVVPGDISDVNGVLLAGSTVTDTENGFTAVRQYNIDPSVRRSVVHVVGDAAGNVANSVETFMARSLYGFEQSITERIRDFVSGARRKGDSLTLTVDSALSAYILGRLEALKLPVTEEGAAALTPAGAVVVMNWKTGAVLAELSYPTFDPANPATAARSSRQPYFNRATQGMYAPGSAFKVVTAAAVLSDPLLSSRSFNCTGAFEAADGENGNRLITDAGTDTAQGMVVSHGQIDLRRAFMLSCNNVFADAATELTDAKLRKQAMAFGFDANFLFREIVVENSSYPDTDRTPWEVAMTGIGQSGLQASPLHLCLIAAAVANGGVMMEPRLIERAAASDGMTRKAFAIQEARRVFDDPALASTLRDYMYDVVNGENGTGRRAALAGWPVCGKTGSAEVDGQERTNAIFIGFIDDERAPYAVSIVLEDMGAGGQYAAPLAHDIFAYLTDKIA